ncbi:hypothetical protein [Phaeodactylibacter luteus]|uniref:Glycosyltransferase RgtA/B/C/D-like domain-containing protein n=1 Tax=Phaeodactylibacter luteus TaxID=1564516 RepID=A0A5C6RN82_9BACT|nr:hypothetical protein [Phaeodactylibacter luteus]TXB62842.1 hypothetical protein FRY97_12250 [Phaeodactylibacter luteus]
MYLHTKCRATTFAARRQVRILNRHDLTSNAMSFQTRLIAFIALFYLCGHFWLGRWQTALFYGDSNSYYLHTLSLLHYQDVGDYSKTIGSLLQAHPGAADPREDKYGVRQTPTGRYYIKYTLGAPLMEAPFYFLGHCWASLSGHYPADGWSRPYILAVSLSTWFYLMAGFYLLAGLLLRYFPPWAVGLTILTLALGTNLFFHSTYLTMAHGFLFFDYCVLLALSERFYRKPGPGSALLIGAVVGLIALTRAPEVISLLIPLLWGVSSQAQFRERLQFFTAHWHYLGLAAIGLLLAFSPQLAYWQYVSGEWLFNPYQGEGFNFLKPRIHKGWFDFANGWLIYTPVMALSLPGLYLLRRFAPGAILPVALFVFLQAYIHYSYYAWTYFPGLGSRPMVEAYAGLSFGLAALLSLGFRRKATAIPLAVFLLACTGLNLFQTWQMQKGIIWSERGNAAFYLETFGATGPSRNALIAYDLKEVQPDTNRLAFQQRLLAHAFPNSTKEWVAPSGEYDLAPGIPLPQQAAGQWLKITLDARIAPGDEVWNRDLTAVLFLFYENEKGHRKKGRHFRISSHLGNEDFNIWSAGKPGPWQEVSFFIRIPRKAAPGWEMQLVLNNSHNQKLRLRQLAVDWYGPS